MEKTPYDVLGVSSDVKQEDLRGIYRELIQKWHPDKVATKSKDVQDEAKKRYDSIDEAYNLLKHPEKRRLYDDTGYIDPPEGKIRSSVQSTLRALLNNYLLRGEEIFTINIIDEINDYCTKQIAANKKSILDLKNKKGFLLRVVQKFKKKPSLKVDFLTNVFVGEMNSIDQSINVKLETILVLTQTKIVINAYDFDFMKTIESSELNTPPGRVNLGNIFELAGVLKSDKSQ